MSAKKKINNNTNCSINTTMQPSSNKIASTCKVVNLNSYQKVYSDKFYSKIAFLSKD
jgi:hypothetical protein